jgi:2,4-dienoyl-CoA reductase-like NADH-dependent reductase (Old Yellow Enzyme family)
MNQEQISQHPGFASFILGNHLLKNRFVVAPMSRVSATSEGIPTDNMKRYYTAFALGGFSMIITEGLYTDLLYSQAYPNQPGMVTRRQLDAWKSITSSVHRHNVTFIAQLMHAGGISQYLPVTKAPSALQPLGRRMAEYGGGDGIFHLPQEMTDTDIRETIGGFVQSARNAYRAGFNGVEIHAANGYLLDQFLTPYINLRKDRWGGTLQNRFRIIKEIITSIRKEVPEGFIIGLRLSEGKVNHLSYRFPAGAVDAKAILEEVNTVKPDYVHIAAETGNWQRDCTYPDGSSYSGLARQITGVPVIANGGLHQLDIGKKVLLGNHADLLALGSAALADHAWPDKIARGIVPIPFRRCFIKPSATIEHTRRMLEQEHESLENAIGN